MPQRLEYDEQGYTFYYFLISFYGLILLPGTYFLWPYKKKGTKASVTSFWCLSFYFSSCVRDVCVCRCV